MRSIFILALWTITASGLEQAQSINVPDANFKAILVASYDTNNEGEIRETEAEAVTGVMGCPGEDIADLTGIASIIKLTGLSNLSTLINEQEKQTRRQAWRKSAKSNNIR